MPCGTPEPTSTGRDFSPSTTTHIFRCVRKQEIHWRIGLRSHRLQAYVGVYDEALCQRFY